MIIQDKIDYMGWNKMLVVILIQKHIESELKIRQKHLCATTHRLIKDSLRQTSCRNSGR